MNQKNRFNIAYFMLFILGFSNAAFSQTKMETASPKFLILIETTSEGLKLTSVEGCAWKELTFAINQDKPQAIDDYGMTSLNTDKFTDNKSASNFYFTIMKTKDGITLEGRKGTAWTKLSFSCDGGRCYQYIDVNGMITKG
jgi:hypothetical protein